MIKHKRYAPTELISIDASLREKNDCSVRSLMVALNKPYIECRALMAHYANRKPNTGVRSAKYLNLLRSLMEERFCYLYGNVFGTLSKTTFSPPFTVGKVLTQYPKGRFVALTQNHAFAIVDGIIHDTYIMGLRNKVYALYQVRP